MVHPLRKLTEAKVIEEAKAAYCYGVLTAQAPKAENRRCWYFIQCGDTARVCAIGAALDNPRLGPHNTGVSRWLYPESDEDAPKYMQDIQFAHDNWVSYSHPRSKGVIGRERLFLLAIGYSKENVYAQ